MTIPILYLFPEKTNEINRVILSFVLIDSHSYPFYDLQSSVPFSVDVSPFTYLIPLCHPDGVS